MSLSEDQRQRMLTTTREAAAAFYEDIRYLGLQIVQGRAETPEIRRAAAILRRFLVDGTLTAIAAPRIGRIKIAGLDTSRFVTASSDCHVKFFAITAVQLPRGTFKGFDHVEVGVIAVADEKFYEAVTRAGQPGTIEMNVDSFLAQKVIRFNGTWISRREIIKHMANIASGVHAGTPTEKIDHTIALMRSVATYTKVEQGTLKLHIDFDKQEPTFSYDRTKMDIAMAELALTSKWLVECTDIQRLFVEVQKELKARP